MEITLKKPLTKVKKIFRETQVMRTIDKNEFYVELGQRIVELRKYKNPPWSADTLAKAAGLSNVTISNIENGKLDHVSFETIRLIAKALQIRMSTLIDSVYLFSVK